MLNTIVAAYARPDYSVEIVYSDGERVVVDFTPVIQKGGVFEALRDADVFAQVVVGDRGRYLSWPRELEFCADALREQAHAIA